jgi:hypothetical protein
MRLLRPLFYSVCVVASCLQSQRLDAEEQPPPIPAEIIIERFAIRNDGRVILLPVTVAGKEHRFLLDTCASMTKVDKSLLRRGVRGDTISVITPTAVIDCEEFDAPQVRVGNVDLRDFAPRVLGGDLASIRKLSGDNIYGILGLDFLSHYVVHLDFEYGECLLLARVPPAAGEKLDLNLRGGVVVRVAGSSPEYFYLDTGADLRQADGIIKQSYYEMLVKSGGARLAGELHRGGSGTSITKVALVNRLEIGPWVTSEPMFFGIGGTSNILGMPFISRFVATFDFPNRCLYLRPRRTFDFPALQGRNRLPIVQRSGKTFVESVRDDAGTAIMR